MTDWLQPLQAAPSPPPGLLEFAATQPSLAATWQNAMRGDWLIWMSARGFAGASSPRDIVDAAVILADFAPPAAWRRALRVTASPEDALRKINFTAGDFDLGQIVAHLYLGATLASLVGFAAYMRTGGRSLLAREGIGVACFIVVCVAVTILAQAVWKASVTRAIAGLTINACVPMALELAVAVSDRSDATKQVVGARLMRKRLAGPVASSAAP